MSNMSGKQKSAANKLLQKKYIPMPMKGLSYCKDLGWSDWGILTMLTVASTDTSILIDSMYSSCKAIINHPYLSDTPLRWLLCVEEV